MYATWLVLSLGVGAGMEGDVWDDFGWREVCEDAAAWTRQPGWLSDPSATAAVGVENGVVRFRVDEPGRGMKWSLDTPPMTLDDTPWLAVRYRAEGADTRGTDYFVYLNDRHPERQLAPIRLCDVVADGQWHVVAGDVSLLTESAAVVGAAVQVQAGPAGRAVVEIDWVQMGAAPPAGAAILRQDAAAPSPPDWQAPLADAPWHAQPSWLANPAADGAHATERQAAATVFQVRPAGRGMKWSWQLPEPVPLAGHRYLSLRYRAVGAGTHSDYAVCVLSRPANAEDLGYAPAVEAAELQVDGRWHTLDVDLRRLAARYPTITGLAVQLQAAAPEARFELAALRLVDQRQPASLADALPWTAGADFGGHVAVPLDGAASMPAAACCERLRLSDWFAGPAVTVEGIPFALREQVPELAATALRAKADLRLATAARASEVYVLLLAAFAGSEEPAYGAGRLRAIRDVDRFRLRLEYADSSADECLPLQIASRQFAIVPGPQVVVAAADPAKELRAIVVKDLCRQAALAVAAVTLRTDGARRVPEACEDAPSVFVGRAADPPPTGPDPQVGLDAAVSLDGLPRWERAVHQPSGWALLASPAALVELTVDGKPIADDRWERTTEAPAASGAGTTAGWAWYRIRELPGLHVGVHVQRRTAADVAVTAVVRNLGPDTHQVALIAPRLGPYRLGQQAEQAYYLMPRRGAVVDRRDGVFRERYCGTFPVQFLDTFSPADRRGLVLRTEDMDCLRKTYLLEKKDGAFTVGVEYADQTLPPGETLPAATAVVTATDGDWHRGLAAYRQWVGSWFQPAAPRQAWFREIFNFRQRFLWSYDPLYDAAAGRLDLPRAVDEARREFGGIDYLHLFDWGNVTGVGRIYGRTGDLSPYDSLRGGRDALRQAIAGVQDQGVPVGLYIEGYLLEERGQLGQQFGPAWQLVDSDKKKRYWPESTEMCICPAVEAWREVQASTYATKVGELEPDGMYIDQFGFAEAGKDCWSSEHGHPVPSYTVVAERDATRLIRQRVAGVKPNVAIYTEETPVDVTAQYQDGSFTYAMLSARQGQTPVPLNLARFALPDLKTIEILFCDKPTGSWATGVRWVFFNGEAIWLEGPAETWFEPETRAEIRRCYAILREHRDAFTGLDPEPLVPTQLAGVFANRFTAGGKTIYTLYNTRHRTVRGPVLRVPHRDGAEYEDAWHGRPADVRRDGQDDVLSTELGPHGAGCLVQRCGA